MRVSFVDVAYRGLKVAQKARWQEGDDGRAFLEHEAPLPVGARLDVSIEGETKQAVVVAVVEQEAGAKSPPGMRLAWADAPASVVEAEKTIPVEAEMIETGSGGIVVEEQGDETSGGKEAAAPGGKRKRGRRKTQNGRVT
jgi:hypothetical protein